MRDYSREETQITRKTYGPTNSPRVDDISFISTYAMRTTTTTNFSQSLSSIGDDMSLEGKPNRTIRLVPGYRAKQTA